MKKVMMNYLQKLALAALVTSLLALPFPLPHKALAARKVRQDNVNRPAGSDFNGDGHADLAVGAPEEDLGAHGEIDDAGAVQVLYGSVSGLSANLPDDQLWTQDGLWTPNGSVQDIKGGPETGDRFGAALATGDFNGDGYCDLAIGIPGEDISGVIDGGAVQVLYGSANGLSATNNQLWTQDSDGVKFVAQSGDHFGNSLGARLGAGGN